MYFFWSRLQNRDISFSRTGGIETVGKFVKWGDATKPIIVYNINNSKEKLLPGIPKYKTAEEYL